MTTTVPLDQVAQNIAKQEAVLAALRREYDARKRRLAELTRRKQQLQNELSKVESDIQTLGGAAAPPPAVPPKTHPAKTHPAKPQPVAKPKAKPKAKSRSGVPLPELVQVILRETGRPLTHRQLTDELTRRNYRTQTTDLLKQVTTRVGEMVKKGQLRRTKDGAATLPAGSAAPAARPTVAAAKTSPAAPTKHGMEKPTLRAMLTGFLEKQKDPITGSELARRAKAAGYQSTSTDFPNLVHVTLNKMDNIERVKGQGYRLKKR